MPLVRNKLPVKRWQAFQSQVDTLSESSSPRDVLEKVLTFIRVNPTICTTRPFSDFGIYKFLEIDERDLPVEYSTLKAKNISHFKNIVKKYTANDAEYIAMLLRGVLEDLTMVEIDRQCSNCHEWGMRVAKSKNTGKICYCCKVCGRMEYSDNSEIESGTDLPTEKELKHLGII